MSQEQCTNCSNLIHVDYAEEYSGRCESCFLKAILKEAQEHLGLAKVSNIHLDLVKKCLVKMEEVLCGKTK